MSIHARGIVLSGEFGKLVVEASDKDVEQFGKGALVEVALKQKPQSSHAGVRHYNHGKTWMPAYGPQWAWPTSPYQSRTQSPTAILRTACGATKEVQVPQPWPKTIQVPLSMGVKYVTQNEMSLTDVAHTTVRVFKLARIHHEPVDVMHGLPGYYVDTPEYEEEL